MAGLSITEQRSDQGDRRNAIAPWGNGKGDILRWLISLALAAVVSYFTASAQVRERIATLEATAEARHAELLRFMQRVDAYMQREAR